MRIQTARKVFWVTFMSIMVSSMIMIGISLIENKKELTNEKDVQEEVTFNDTLKQHR